MKKVIGYLLIVAGFFFVALGVSNANQAISNLVSVPEISPITTNIIGIILIVAGIYFTWAHRGSRTNSPHGEVPIYHGEGKNRKIVGYRKVE